MDGDREEQDDFIALYGERDGEAPRPRDGSGDNAEAGESRESDFAGDFDSPADTGAVFDRDGGEEPAEEDRFAAVDGGGAGGKPYRTSPMTPIEEPPDSEREPL